MKKRLLLIPVTAIAVIAGIWTQKPVTAKAADDFVIVLDPGHDATHVGARGYGLKEEELNMKIALSCKAELEKYDGVKVYLTHPTIDCGLPGSSTRECLYSRPDYAKSVGASLYVSLHNNAGMDTSGHEVYYPNANYIPEFNVEGAALAQCISDKLSDIGINDRGIHTRDSNGDEDDETNWYDDGSRADYYAVIRGSKKNGFIGLIVEHAYISNANDASLLGDDNMLALMGQADAQGIAEYYGFAKKSGIIYSNDRWGMYNDGELQSDYNGLSSNNNGWWKITNGYVDFDYTGIVYDEERGWWYVKDGAVQFGYNGLKYNENGWWKITNGYVDFEYTGVAYGEESGWWYVKDGAVQFGYNGLKSNENGWWKITDGYADFGYTGITYDEERGWWYVKDGAVQFEYNGLKYNENGWWKITDGYVDFEYTGVAYGEESGWWYVKDGAVQFGYNGIKSNENGWWMITDGYVDFGYTGLLYDEESGSWYYIEDGKVRFDYTGLVKHNDSLYYVDKGLMNMNYSGEYKSDGHTYVITNGYVTQVKHSWDDGVTVTEATCTDNGIIRYTCKSCDETKEEVIKAKGHEYSWVVAKPATTSEEGLEEYKCLVCGDVKETRKLEKLQAEGDKKTDNNNVSDKNITDKDVADKDIANKNITDKISSDNKASADNKQIDRSTKEDVISSVNNQ